MANPPVPFPSGEHIEKNTTAGYARNLWVPSSFDYKVFEDNFWGDTLLTEYPAAKTNGTSAAVTFTEHNANGYLDIDAGSDDDGYAGQGLGHQFTGDRGVLFEGVIVLPADISEMKFEIGLTDADDDAGAVIDNQASPITVTATDTAVFVYDNDTNNGTDGTIDFVSAKAGTVVSTTAVWTPSASDTLRFAVRIEGDVVTAWINGTWVAGTTHAIEGGNKLTPWVFSQNRSASQRIVQLHKWRCITPTY